MKNPKDRRGSNIHNIEPTVDICVRDIRSDNDVILRFKDTPLSRAGFMFDKVRDKYGSSKKSLWEQWEDMLISDIKGGKEQLKRKGLIGSIKEDLGRGKK